MIRVLVLAATVAVVPSAAPSAPPLNLPRAHVPCGTFSPAAVGVAEKIDTDAIGRLYARALDAEGAGKPGVGVTVQTMALALSDVLGCFGKAPQ